MRENTMPTTDIVEAFLIGDTKTDQDAENERRLFIQGLRDLAVFLESHPAVPTPYSNDINVFVSTKEELATIARSSTWAKDVNDDYFWLVKRFVGNVSIQVNTTRDNVCRRVVVGQKVIPAQPERIVDDVQWECDDPLLSDGIES
jgi:hypothetical protein